MTRRFVPSSREPLWPAAGTPEWPDLAPLPPLPPCPVVLADCRAGDRVLLANGEHADITSISPCAITLRPTKRSTRTVFDSRNDREVTFTVRNRSYTVSPSTTVQAVVEHTPVAPTCKNGEGGPDGHKASDG